MISVLLPTRQRPQMFETSVRSLMGAAHRNFQLLVAVDPDDVDTYAPELPKWVAPERYGYSNLNIYYNALAERATGDWLLLWNDDAIMDTLGWDQILMDLPPTTLIADLQSQHSPHLCCFPAVRKAAVRAVGGFSPHTPHCDTYWQDIGHATGSIQSVPIHVDHRRFDLSGTNNDQVWTDGQAGYRSNEYYGEYVQGKIQRDIETIRGLQ